MKIEGELLKRRRGTSRRREKGQKMVMRVLM
jgi:hypothetical protein